MDVVYDGTFEGLLSAFFTIYASKIQSPGIYKKSRYEPSLFANKIEVKTCPEKAARVLKKLKAKTGRQFIQFFYAAHNDRDHVENDLFVYLNYVIYGKTKRSANYSNQAVLKVAQLAKAVAREKHRMEAFVRFRLTRDGIYFASISPDFDVTPLIKNHFEERYADQKWIIYDLSRDYGMYYDLKSTTPIMMTFTSGKTDILNTSGEHFTADEIAFQELWTLYFKKTNIESRKNMRLHLQHVPKRYWKYLSEKRFES